VPINAAIWFKITRWFIANISLSCHTNLNFKGSLLHYLGWQLLLSLPFFTFMGWPLFGHYLGWQFYASISLFNLISLTGVPPVLVTVKPNVEPVKI
jgi:hypothetical protein